MKNRIFKIIFCLVGFVATSSTHTRHNNRTHLNESLQPTNLCLGYLALTPSSNAVNIFTQLGYIHDILLLLVREKLKKKYALSPKDYQNLQLAESIFLENLNPFLAIVPVAQQLFGETNATSALEDERRRYQVLKQ